MKRIEFSLLLGAFVACLTLAVPKLPVYQPGNTYGYGLPFSYIYQEKSIEYPTNTRIGLGDIREHVTSARWEFFALDILIWSLVVYMLLQTKVFLPSKR